MFNASRGVGLSALGLAACMLAQGATAQQAAAPPASPYYSTQKSISPPPAPGVPPLPQWSLKSPGAKPVMGAVNVGPGLDGPNVYDLEKLGYVEEEYFLTGKANVYTTGGQGIAKADVPYVTRILVRRPKDAGKFSGTVVIEPSRDVNEWTTTWPSAAPYMIESGHVFVAFTMAKANLTQFFMDYDKERYASLAIADEGLRWDFMAQTAGLLRSTEGPLAKLGFLSRAAARKGGLKMISTGTSLTGGMQASFIDNGHHARARSASGGSVMDGYLLLVSGRPRNLPPDAPLIAIVAEGDMARGIGPMRLVSLRAPDSDGPVRFRWYEIAGTGHANWGDQSQFTPAFQLIGAKEKSTIRCKTPVSDVAAKDDFTTAALANLEAWLRDDIAPPPGRVLDLAADNTIKRDAHGNALGGVRPYWVQVPVTKVAPVNAEAEGSANIAATGGLCGMFAAEAPLPAGELAKLYKTRADYLSKVERHLDSLVAERYLLPEGKKHQFAQAKEAKVP